MEYLIKNLVLDLAELDEVDNFTVKQNNANINRINISFLNDRNDYDLTGTTIMATINMPGHATDACVLETPTEEPLNQTYLILKPEWLSKKGTIKIEFQISKDNEIVNSKTIYVIVEKSIVNDNPIVNPSIMPGIEEILKNTSSIKEFTVGQTYYAGDIIKAELPNIYEVGLDGTYDLFICYAMFTATMSNINYYIGSYVYAMPSYNYINDGITLNEYSHYYSPVSTKDLEDNVYLKTEVDTKLNNIQAGAVDLSNYYNKSEVDSKIPVIPALPTEFGSGSGNNSLKQSLKCIADGQYSFAANIGNTQPVAANSAAFNQSIAGGMNQLTAGKFNIIDTNGDYAFIIGNGVNTLQRHNAATVDWFGMARFAGKVFANNNQELATIEYTDAKANSCVSIKEFKTGQIYNVGDVLKFNIPDQDDFGYAGGPALAICVEQFTATQDILNHLNIQLMPIATNKTNNDNIGIYPYNFYFSPVTTKDLEDNVYMKYEIDAKLGDIETLLDNINNTI